MENKPATPLSPRGYRVLVLQDPIEQISDGGIVLNSPGEAKRQQKGYMFGTLMAVGDQAWTDQRLGGSPWAAVGDRVMFSRYAGHAFHQESDGRWWHVMNDEDILGVAP